jgi:hypothetical protein
VKFNSERGPNGVQAGATDEDAIKTKSVESSLARQNLKALGGGTVATRARASSLHASSVIEFSGLHPRNRIDSLGVPSFLKKASYWQERGYADAVGDAPAVEGGQGGRSASSEEKSDGVGGGPWRCAHALPPSAGGWAHGQ